MIRDKIKKELESWTIKHLRETPNAYIPPYGDYNFHVEEKCVVATVVAYNNVSGQLGLNTACYRTISFRLEHPTITKLLETSEDRYLLKSLPDKGIRITRELKLRKILK